MDTWSKFAAAFLDPGVAAAWTPAILSGTLVTISMGAAVVVAGIASGLVLALTRAFGLTPVNLVIIFVIDVMRTVPPLVLIVFFYFALPSLGISASGWVCAWAALSLILMAFSEEIFWAGIRSIPSGQWEAARSTGLTFWATLRHVAMPQAIRLTIPPLTNRAIAIVKATSFASVIAVQDTLGTAQTAVTYSFNATPLVIAAVIYLVLFMPLIAFARRIEARFGWRR